jgi:hypothetical protein
MYSTARNRAIFVAVLALLGCGAASAGGAPPPRILQEPLLGLRYEPAKVKFEPLLPDEFVKCGKLVGDDEKWRSHFWIFAAAHDAGRTYYIVGGYYERRYPEQGEHLYELDEPGVALQIEGLKCEAFGQARELFDLRDQTPQSILRQLAADAVARLSRAFGGPDRLRGELQGQRIDPDPLPVELRDAFKPYFGR